MEAGGQLGHVGSLCLYDAKGLRGRSFRDALERRRSRRACTCCRRTGAASSRCRSTSTAPTGSRTRTSTSTSTSDTSRCRRPATSSSSPSSSRASTRAPLDRARPLWEIYVIEGCRERARRALHQDPPLHDRRRLGRRDDAGAARSHARRATEVPGRREREARGGAGRRSRCSRAACSASLRPPERIARTVFRTARSLGRARGARRGRAQRSASTGCPLAGGWLRRRGPQVDADPIPQTPAPRTPLNRSITPHRRFAFFSLPLADFKHVKSAFGTTLNDVVMAVSGSALRRYLERRRTRCPTTPLKAMVPVSVRSARARSATYTNRVTQVLAELATDDRRPGGAPAPHPRRDEVGQAHAAGDARDAAHRLDAR